MDALYFRVSSDRQTTQNQFDDLLQIAEHDNSGRDWDQIRETLAHCVVEEIRKTPRGDTTTVYRVLHERAERLAAQCVYVEQGRSSKVGAKARPLFERLKRDAAARKFDRLLVWKVSRLGRNMREVIDAVYELSDHGVTVFPVKSQTGPITSTLGKLLWAIQAWFAEMENEERSEAIRAGHARAKAKGTTVGRPHVIFRRDAVAELRDGEDHLSWSQIAARLGVSVGTVRRVYQQSAGAPRPCQNSGGDAA